MRRLRELRATIVEAAKQWSDDRAQSMGAALSYYSLFSITPLLIIAIAIAGFFFGEDAARGEILTQLQGLLGEPGARAVQDLIASAGQVSGGVVAGGLALITLLIGATTVFAELQEDLDRIWRVEVSKETSGVWNLVRARFLSFGMVLGVGFLLLVSLLISATLSALGRYWSNAFGPDIQLLEWLNVGVSFAMVTFLFAAIYRFLPRAKIEWKDVWLGAALTALLFGIGKFFIGLYLGHSGVASAYGAAGSLVVLLIWIYYSAQIFFFGAELTYIHSKRKHSA